jgi:murein DD-endopeptidase MepM/ murein hydrolase activator NlpD
MKNRSKSYTILIVPDDRGRTYTVTLPSAMLRALVALLLLFAIGIFILICRSAEIGMKLQLAQRLVEQNEQLRAENDRIQDVRAAIARLETMNVYFQRLALGDDSSGSSGILPAHLSDMAPDQSQAQAPEDPLPDSVTHASLLAARRRLNYTEQMLQSIPYIRPLRGWITRTFKDDDGLDRHAGVDFAAAEGTPIRATAPGIVQSVTVDRFLGNKLTIKHRFGFATLFGHCQQILVAEGDHVQRGQTIALVGNTGRSTAPHLHYAVIKDGKEVDPLQYIVD